MKKTKLNWKFISKLGFSILGVLFIVFAITYGWRLISSSNAFSTNRLTSSRKISFADQPSTILLLGVDGLDKKDAQNEYEKSERSGQQRSDSMILMDFNPETGVANMTSLMRDTKLPIACDNNNEDKLGNAFAHAQNNSNSNDKNITLGAECVINSIESKFGIPVDNYVYVNFSGFIKLIEKLDGIDIDVIGDAPKGTKFCEQDEHGNGGNPDENTWNVGKYCFYVGKKMHLNAEQALAYSRHRHMDSDSWRTKRQQQVMKTIFKEILKPSRILNLPDLLSSLSESIKSTIKISDILDFVKKHNEYISDMDNSLVLKSANIKYNDSMINGIYYSILDPVDLKRRVKAIKENLEIDKNKKQIPAKIKEFDFDYYKYK